MTTLTVPNSQLSEKQIPTKRAPTEIMRKVIEKQVVRAQEGTSYHMTGWTSPADIPKTKGIAVIILMAATLAVLESSLAFPAIVFRKSRRAVSPDTLAEGTRLFRNMLDM